MKIINKVRSLPGIWVFVLAIGIALGGYFVGDGIYRASTVRTVTVKGLAERDVVADTAVWNIKINGVGGDLSALQKSIDNDRRILKSSYISKEEALAEETEALKANPAEILGYNPYEASIELTMKPEFSNSVELENLKQTLIKKRGIKEIIYQRDLVDTINSNIQRAGFMLLALLVMLTLISWSLIGNLVRLSIYSKRFLLHTMKLVGATWSFICRPFIVKNMWIGFLSGIIANLLLSAGLYILSHSEPGIMSILPIDGLIAVGVGITLFGMTICMLCAFLSVRRFLRMRKNDLYFI